MKKTGRAMGLETNHRRKIVYALGATHCFALTGDVWFELVKSKAQTLTLADVLRDVEKGTNTVISCDSPQFRERTINYLRRNFRAIFAQK